ncbi:hypothetical protein UT300012_31210 [Paraclostridium bifermentans]
MRYNDDFRREIFKKYEEIEQKIIGLKSIVSNSFEVTESDLREQELLGKEVIYKLQELQLRLLQGR